MPGMFAACRWPRHALLSVQQHFWLFLGGLWPTQSVALPSFFLGMGVTNFAWAPPLVLDTWMEYRGDHLCTSSVGNTPTSRSGTSEVRFSGHPADQGANSVPPVAGNQNGRSLGSSQQSMPIDKRSEVIQDTTNDVTKTYDQELQKIKHFYKVYKVWIKQY